MAKPRHLTALLLLPTLVSLGCPPSPTRPPTDAGRGGGAPDAAACELAACPAGAYDQCEVGDSVAPCCQGSASSQVCARPAGRLVHSAACDAACPATPAPICAVDDSGALTCCAWSGSADGGAMSAGPCDVAPDAGE